LGAGGQTKGGKDGRSIGAVRGAQARVGGIVGDELTAKVGLSQGVVVNTSVPVASEVVGDELVHGTSVLEKTAGINEGVLASKLSGAAKRVDSIGKSVNGISVVEGLGAEHLEEGGVTKKG